MEGSQLMDDKSHNHGSDYDVIDAHGLGLNVTNQKQGTHGLVREEARVSSFKEHGVHGLIGEAAGVFGGGVQQMAADTHMSGDALGLGFAKRGYTTIDSSMVGEAARVSTPRQKQGSDAHGFTGAAARVFGGGDNQTGADTHTRRDTLGLGFAKHGYTTIDSSMVGISRDTLLTSSNSATDMCRVTLQNKNAGYETAGPSFAQ
ncbi:hypothetical protein TorRG33x02_337490, partial [Trema orientale]